MKDMYAVIGNPIGHTKSPFIHKSFAAISGQELEYVPIEGKLEQGNPNAFTEQVLTLFHSGKLLGLNVTAPFKMDALALANVALKRAQMAGASNTLKYQDGQIIADNFDGIGLLRDIETNLGMPFRGKRILLMGAGGAARGALMPFLNAAPEEIVIVNRTIIKAQELAKINAIYGKITPCGYDDLKSEYFDIVINATSASLKGELAPLTSNVFKNSKLAYELAYGKGKTPFLKLAESKSDAILKDGVGMLVEQAAEAFAWWRGLRPQTNDVINQLTIPLI